MRSLNWSLHTGVEALIDQEGFASHLVIFIICSGILFGALILSPAESGTSHLSLGGFLLPDLCVFRGITGIPCPGCGLTRSISAAVHGNIEMSLAHHRLGLLTLAYIFFQLSFSLGFLLIPKWRPRILHYGKLLNRGLIPLVILFVLNWVLTLFI